MAKLALNKQTLHKERTQLQVYRRVLPSLELKRRQLTIEADRARAQLAQQEAEFTRLHEHIPEQLPMLAVEKIVVEGLVRVTSVVLGEDNVVGVRLPILENVVCEVQPYSMLAKPHWVDLLVTYLKQAATLQIRLQVATERIKRLDYAVRKTTQRVNLFEKILIPNAQKNIQRIRIFLGDAERAAIVRAKIAKAMQKRQQEIINEEG